MSENEAESGAVRLAGIDDSESIARLLHDFNVEYGDPSPEPHVLARRIRALLASGDSIAILGGEEPDGVAFLRFRPGLFTAGSECYLAELYVVPPRRRHGLGRALMEAAIDHARRMGAETMDLGTSENDVAARHLYESLTFINREGGPGGPVMYVYERNL